MFPRRKLCFTARGFTLLEVVTVILVISILLVLLLPVYSQILHRMDKAGCISNLRSLQVGMNLYLQEHHSWPQVATDGVEPQDLATHWIAILQPYGLTQASWLCPTVQKNYGNPDMTDHDNVRIDYVPMTFDANPQTPYRWSTTMPWFAESADSHGNGQLLTFADGHIQEVGDFKYLFKKKSPSPH